MADPRPPGLILVAPMQGWVGPLDEAPDPVFAERMLGDGLAIDPTGRGLHAPCAGEVISLHRAGHAVSLRAENGAEILMHIGLETVALGGEGFEAHVRDGQRVAAGALLISFDLDFLARRVRSLLTPILVANGAEFAITARHQNRQTKVGEALMEIAPIAAATAGGAGPAASFASARVRIPLAHGLHARPAARIANAARAFASEIVLATPARRADAKSPVALMTLGLARGDRARLSASGSDAGAAVAAMARLIESELVDEPGPTPEGAAPSTGGRLDAEGAIVGVRAAPGLAIGPAFQMVMDRIEVTEKGGGPEREARALGEALTAVRRRLESGGASGTAERRAIGLAHLALLEDRGLNRAAGAAIADGASAGAAWRSAVEAQAKLLRAVADRRIAERADDLFDLENQVLGEITGRRPTTPAPPDRAILLARDLLPSQLMALEGTGIAGICTAGGGPTSHVAILAAAMNIPAVVAAGPAVTAIEDGAGLILDGDAGTLRVTSDPAAIAAARARLAASRDRAERARASAGEDCRMADGTRIEIFANLGSLADAKTAVAAGAEGCGLLRTEFLFLDRDQAPGEDEQAEIYQAIATALEGRPLIIRTLDVGADKPAPFLDLPPEENPALGMRGVRIGLARPDLLRDQLRAVLRVRPAGQCRIMLPMITSLDEIIAVRRLLDELRAELAVSDPVALGVMIETPAAAVCADLLATRADFLSIGTNDLSQYALAMDRGNPLLAARVDALHPAVLRLIFQAAQGGRRHGRPTGVCGALASDLAAAPILLGLGVTELSAAPHLAAELKALVRTLSPDACADLARQAMDETSAEGVRALLAAGARR